VEGTDEEATSPVVAFVLGAGDECTAAGCTLGTVGAAVDVGDSGEEEALTACIRKDSGGSSDFDAFAKSGEMSRGRGGKGG
jgi:hypothetical protein